ncbi:phage holin family protein [Solicola sp. PLA-1-18]|uniref:phage holin family protein n=1 Tax=Solicola sp. PLA-1-18 TaxID=3380532 RepID=UPI003B7C9F8A
MTVSDDARRDAATDDRSVGEILGDITTDLTTMVRQELELAKTEAKQEVTKLGTGAGLLGAAGLAGWMFLVFFSLFAVYLLDKVVDAWLAALVVAVVWGAAAAVLALLGRTKIKQANLQLPTTQQSIKEDLR